MNDLSGKVAIVSGASRGLGRAVAGELAAGCVAVVLAARDRGECPPARPHHEAAGRTARPRRTGGGPPRSPSRLPVAVHAHPRRSASARRRPHAARGSRVAPCGTVAAHEQAEVPASVGPSAGSLRDPAGGS